MAKIKQIGAIPVFVIMCVITGIAELIPWILVIPGWIRKIRNPGVIWDKSCKTLNSTLEWVDGFVTAQNMNIPIPVQLLIVVLLAVVILAFAGVCYILIPLGVIGIGGSIASLLIIPTVDLYNACRGERYPLSGVEVYKDLDFTINFPGIEAAVLKQKEKRAQKIAKDQFDEYEENRRIYEKCYNEERERRGYEEEDETQNIGTDQPVNTEREKYEKALIRMQYSIGDHFTKSELKRRYKKLAAIAHPDNNGGSDKSMVELTAAYEYLLAYAEDDPVEANR